MDLVSLINDRNKAYQKLTEEIISIYSEVFNTAFSVIAQPNMEAVWSTVEVYSTSPLFVTLYGSTTYAVGSILKSEDGNDLIYIDETNKNNYSKVFKMILPIELVVKFDLLGVVDFITEYIELAKNVNPEDFEKLLNDREFLRKNFSTFDTNRELKSHTITNKLSPMYNNSTDNYEGFDLGKCGIDDIQKINLKIGKFEGNV